MSNTGIRAQGSAITAQDSALSSTTDYFGQGEPTEGVTIVDDTLREMMTLLVRIAGTDEEGERQSLLGRLIELQRQNNELVARVGTKMEKMLVGSVTVSTNTDEEGKGIIEETASLVAITSAFGQPELGLVLGMARDQSFQFQSDLDQEIMQDMQLMNLKRKSAKLSAQDYMNIYGDTSKARYKYLMYLSKNDKELYKKELAIAPRGLTFSEAKQMRIEKGPPEPQPTSLKPISEGIGKWLDSQNLVLYPDTGLVLNGVGKTISSPFANARNDGADDIGGIGTALGISDPLTGAGAVVDFPLSCGCVSNTQNDFAERLTDALERLVEVCALPRVSVGTLAETAIIREEADLDALARRFADELLRAQLAS